MRPILVAHPRIDLSIMLSSTFHIELSFEVTEQFFYAQMSFYTTAKLTGMCWLWMAVSSAQSEMNSATRK